jgi:hypothetical protein
MRREPRTRTTRVATCFVATCVLTEHDALAYMADRLQRIAARWPRTELPIGVSPARS